MAKKQKLKILAALTVMAIAIALIQATPLALLPHSVDGFVQGGAAGMATVLVIAWLVSRYGTGKE